MREIMDVAQDTGIRELTCMCSAQSAKTETILVILLWIIANDPGPILWVTKNKEEAKKLVKMRLGYMMEHCVPVAERMPKTREKKTTLEIYFPGAPLVIAGADSPAALQSTPYRYVIGDEARSWKPGAGEMVAKRVRSYTHNYKFILISTPGKERDTLHASYLQGDQRRRLVPCPKCGHEHEMEWGDRNTEGGLKWDTNHETKPDGKWDWDKLSETIRYKCWNKECGHESKDTLAERKWFSREGRWQANNNLASSDHASFGWCALMPYWASWKTQVREYLNARLAAKYGDPSKLKDHYTETRGQPWNDDLLFVGDDDWLENRMANYSPHDQWDDALRVLATMDVQGKGGRHYWYVIRAWGRNECRLLDWGRADSKTEMDSILDGWKVARANRCWDAAHFSTEVYNYVVASGYVEKAMRGDYREAFTVNGVKTILQKVKADPAMGTEKQGKVMPIDLWQWSKYAVLDRLQMLKDGSAGNWKVPYNIDENYRTQITAWERRDKARPDGTYTKEWYCRRKGNEHLHACEEMQVVAAVKLGLFVKPDEVPPLL